MNIKTLNSENCLIVYNKRKKLTVYLYIKLLWNKRYCFMWKWGTLKKSLGYVTIVPHMFYAWFYLSPTHGCVHLLYNTSLLSAQLLFLSGAFFIVVQVISTVGCIIIHPPKRIYSKPGCLGMCKHETRKSCLWS